MLNRIEISPNILAGQPVIKGTRVPIYMILKTLKTLKTFDKVIEQYPGITNEDIQDALTFASNLANFNEFQLYAEV